MISAAKPTGHGHATEQRAIRLYGSNVSTTRKEAVAIAINIIASIFRTAVAGDNKLPPIAPVPSMMLINAQK